VRERPLIGHSAGSLRRQSFPANLPSRVVQSIRPSAKAVVRLQQLRTTSRRKIKTAKKYADDHILCFMLRGGTAQMAAWINECGCRPSDAGSGPAMEYDEDS
jgi:hypothetical protein